MRMALIALASVLVPTLAAAQQGTALEVGRNFRAHEVGCQIEPATDSCQLTVPRLEQQPALVHTATLTVLAHAGHRCRGHLSISDVNPETWFDDVPLITLYAADSPASLSLTFNRPIRIAAEDNFSISVRELGSPGSRSPGCVAEAVLGLELVN